MLDTHLQLIRCLLPQSPAHLRLTSYRVPPQREVVDDGFSAGNASTGGTGLTTTRTRTIARARTGAGASGAVVRPP